MFCKPRFGDCPLGYYLMILCMNFSQNLEFLLPLWKAAAPTHILLRFVLTHSLGFDVAWTTFSLVILRSMCFHFAAPRCRKVRCLRVLDFLQSMLIVCCCAMCWAAGAQLASLSERSSVWASAGWTLLAFSCAFVSLKGKVALAVGGAGQARTCTQLRDADNVFSI